MVIGPDLKDVKSRRPAEWIHKWVKSSSAVLKSGDAYANDLFNKFNKVSMPDQRLSDADIDAVLAYIDKKGKEPAPVAAAASEASGEEGESSDNTGMWLLVAVALIGIVYIVSSVKNRLEKVIRTKQGLPEPTKRAFREWARQNKKKNCYRLDSL